MDFSYSVLALVSVNAVSHKDLSDFDHKNALGDGLLDFIGMRSRGD